MMKTLTCCLCHGHRTQAYPTCDGIDGIRTYSSRPRVVETQQTQIGQLIRSEFYQGSF